MKITYHLLRCHRRYTRESPATRRKESRTPRGCSSTLCRPFCAPGHRPCSFLLLVAIPGPACSEGPHAHHQSAADHEQPCARSREGHRALPQRDSRVRVQRRDRPGRGREAVRGLVPCVPGVQPGRGKPQASVGRCGDALPVPHMPPAWLPRDSPVRATGAGQMQGSQAGTFAGVGLSS